jgi:PAS domain S-box-containing protein
MIWTTDTELRLTSNMGGGLALVDVVPGQFVGMTLWELFEPTDDQSVAIDAHRRALAGERVDYEAEWRHRKLRGHVEPLHDRAGKIVGVVGTSEDITELARSEKALRASEQKYRTLIETTRTGFAIIDGAGRVIDANAEYVRLTGHASLEDIRGRQVTEWTAEYDLERNAAEVRKCFERGETRDLEIDYVGPQGGASIEINAAVIETEEGRRITALCRDITERRHARRQLERMQAELRRHEIMAAMGALVAGVAHEVRNPLFGITATLDAFEARFGQRPEFEQYIAVFRGESNRLRALMQEILEYGELQEVVLTPGSVAELIAEAVALCAPLARESNVRIVTDGLPGKVLVAMQRDRLRRAFQNLLQNGIQASPPGGSIMVETREISQNGTSWVECAVVDCGAGFREEDLPRVFEPFFTRGKGGTGFGLSIVQRVVQEHGGTVSARSRPEGGAVVAIRLPRLPR